VIKREAENILKYKDLVSVPSKPWESISNNQKNVNMKMTGVPSDIKLSSFDNSQTREESQKNGEECSLAEGE
jgi:hypothetical protein